MEARGNHQIDRTYYEKPDMGQWLGRIDGMDEAHLRWHQQVLPLDLLQPHHDVVSPTVVLLGFACDEGVKRNKGRIGAAKGPNAIRKALCNLPIFYPKLHIYDAGNIRCQDDSLETAQQNLALAVTQILHLGAFPILLGGGHEITYGHYRGIHQFIGSKVGIVNFDAHFDNRTPIPEGATSGTGFWQIAIDCQSQQEAFEYLVLGIQKTSNTPALFETAHQSGTRYVLAKHFHSDYKHIAEQYIGDFIERNDRIYITVDLDVFASPYAPGVSAPAYNGILPDAIFFDSLDQLFNSGKVVSVDIAELNPQYDIDNRTVRLAASIIFHMVERLGVVSKESVKK